MTYPCIYIHNPLTFELAFSGEQKLFYKCLLRNIKTDAAITEIKLSSYSSAPSPEIFYICKEVG